MKKRILSIALAAAAIVGVMTGCGSNATVAAGTSSSDTTTSASSVSSSDTLAKVISSNKLTIGCILSNAPYGSTDEKGNPIGYDVDLGNHLADEMGIGNENVTWVDLNADARIPALESGKVDVIIGDFTMTLTRAQKVQFTDPYDAAAAGVLTLTDNTIEHATDLAGKTVGAARGSTNEDSGEALVASGVDMNLQLYDNADDMLTALKSGQLDAIIADSTYCAYQAKTYPDQYAYCVTDYTEMLIEPFYNGFGVRLGDQNWLNYLNDYIYEINATGLNEQYYEKWFGAERTIPLNPAY